MSIFTGLANLIVGLTAIFRAKYFRVKGALKPLFVVVRGNIGGNEVLAGCSMACLIVGLALVWLPLAPIVLGLAGLAIAVINARIR